MSKRLFLMLFVMFAAAWGCQTDKADSNVVETPNDPEDNDPGDGVLNQAEGDDSEGEKNTPVEEKEGEPGEDPVATGDECGADGQCATGQAPVLETVELFDLGDGNALLVAEGSDEDGDARSLKVNLLGEGGAVMNMGGQTEFMVQPATDLSGQTEFTATLYLYLTELPGLTGVRLALVDALEHVSEEATANLVPLPRPGAGEPCDIELLRNKCAVGSFCDVGASLCVESAPPELLGAGVRLVEPGVYRLSLNGRDVDGDVVGVELTFVDASGVDLPLPAELALPTDLLFALSWPAQGQTELESATEVIFLSPLRGEDMTPAGAAGFRMELIDQAENQSSSLTAMWEDLGRPAESEECDPRGLTSLCQEGLVCSPQARACVAEGTESASRCGADAPVLEPGVETPVDQRSFVSAFKGSCGGGGSEALFVLQIEVPSQVSITTDLPGTPSETDTVLYLRSSCQDPATELACHDDFDPFSQRYLSTLELPALDPGTYYLFADSYRSGGVFHVLATVTPL